MTEFHAGQFDIAVIGAGHAGCEAALACARMGLDTLLLTLNLDSIALMPCNPAIGGTGKGHLVREIDALGGEMGRAIDDTFIQSRMLNTGKGPAVHSLRAQADKRAYQQRMKHALFAEPRLTVRQGECGRFLTENGAISGLETTTGAAIACRAVVVCSGVYMDSRIIIGECSWMGGPQGLLSSSHLAGALRELGISLRRFKTGTPPRVEESSIDFSEMEPQPGDETITPFSFLTDGALENRAQCYLTYTNEETHRIIRENIHRAPMYAGTIHGTGARYCPSIEDKIMRFADKDRHQLFLEPEGLNTVEWYVQGLSTSMPEDVLVHAWFTPDSSFADRMQALRSRCDELHHMDLGLDLGTLEISTLNVRDEDWAEVWKKFYKPFKAGRSLVVKPTWEHYDPQPGDRIIEIDPGMAFGSGTHETTSMCLELLEDAMHGGESVIDVGTGSGILAIGAAMLGAKDVLAIDIDPVAVRVAKENIEHNHLSDRVRAVEGNLLASSDGVCDLCVANIIADVICMFAQPLVDHIVPGGLFICSGIIKEREQDVVNALTAADYTILETKRKGEWVAMLSRRKK